MKYRIPYTVEEFNVYNIDNKKEQKEEFEAETDQDALGIYRDFKRTMAFRSRPHGMRYEIGDLRKIVQEEVSVLVI